MATYADDMAENEIEIAGEMGLPFTAKLSVRFKRRWSDRANQLIDDVSRESGMDVDELENRMEADERLESTMLEAVAKAGRVSDPEYREALARVVAAAFADDAKVDEIEQLAAQLITLDAFALRVLDRAYRQKDGRLLTSPDRAIALHRLWTTLDVAMPVLSAALARLAGLGLVSTAVTFGDPDEGFSEALADQREYWLTTRWGLRAVELCRRQLDDLDPSPT